MTQGRRLGWIVYGGLALALLAATALMALVDGDGIVATAHGVGALVFAIVGGWSLATGRDSPLRPGLVAGLLLIAASLISFVGVFIPSLLPTRLPWAMALTAAVSAIALDVVADRYADTLEQLHG